MPNQAPLGPPAKLLGDALDLGNEFVAGTFARDLCVTCGSPAIDLLDGSVASIETPCVLQAILLGWSVGKDHPEFVVAPRFALTFFIPTLLDLPLTNRFREYAAQIIGVNEGVLLDDFAKCLLKLLNCHLCASQARLDVLLIQDF